MKVTSDASITSVHREVQSWVIRETESRQEKKRQILVVVVHLLTMRFCHELWCFFFNFIFGVCVEFVLRRKIKFQVYTLKIE